MTPDLTILPARPITLQSVQPVLRLHLDARLLTLGYEVLGVYAGWRADGEPTWPIPAYTTTGGDALLEQAAAHAAMLCDARALGWPGLGPWGLSPEHTAAWDAITALTAAATAPV